jgi:DNA-binding NarL/FixJ family response regulator
MKNKVAEEMQERLAAAETTVRALQRHRSDLLRRIRSTIADIRTQRERLSARAPGSKRPTASSPEARLEAKFNLTPRECQVAILLAGGASNATIAEALSISEHTARHHTRSILLKLGLHSRARAAAVLLRELGTAVLSPGA